MMVSSKVTQGTGSPLGNSACDAAWLNAPGSPWKAMSLAMVERAPKSRMAGSMNPAPGPSQCGPAQQNTDKKNQKQPKKQQTILPAQRDGGPALRLRRSGGYS